MASCPVRISYLADPVGKVYNGARSVGFIASFYKTKDRDGVSLPLCYHFVFLKDQRENDVVVDPK
jgi:hypothetical protein